MVGAGGRGYRAYGTYALAHPDEARFVAVAEPDQERRLRFADAHAIPPDRQFVSWEELAARPALATAAVNATMDRMHYPSALGLLEAGYDLLLEKPMATTPQECVGLVRAAEQRGRILQICHVLRYAPFFRAVHDLLTQGRLGTIVSLEWNENLVYWHYAHSFVRGNWANAQRSGPMILTKCCHDLDLLIWMLGGRPEQVASFGELRHFRSERVGPEIPDRCTDGCPIEDECPYYAPRVYIERDPGRWARDAVSLDNSPRALLRALETGPYGRCVYRSDNDVVDHQVVLMRFATGLAAALTMQGASYVEGRTLRIDGVRATLLGNEARSELQIHDHVSGEREILGVGAEGGHGGGDERIMHAFVSALREGNRQVLTSATEALDSHLLAFAAEEARRSRGVVQTSEYWRTMGAA
jgi:predicted dehydrogenase